MAGEHAWEELPCFNQLSKHCERAIGCCGWDDATIVVTERLLSVFFFLGGSRVTDGYGRDYARPRPPHEVEQMAPKSHYAMEDADVGVPGDGG